jgi:cytidylate kinase
MPLRVTIAGDIGSGKSTVAKRLAELVGVDALSTGGIQRQLAQKRGLTVLELNKLAEEDASIDRDIDSYLMDLSPGDLVVESRMAWHFVPDTLKAYLYISDKAAARRILGAQRSDEDYRKTADPTEQILARRNSEVIRFKKYYNVDIDNLMNYDLVIDTTFAAVDEVVKQITEYKEFQNRPTCLIDPRNLVPTQGVRESARDQFSIVEKSIQSHGFDFAKPILTLYVGHVFYVLDGHVRTAAAVRSGTKFVPCTVGASNNEPYIRGLSAQQYVKDAVHDSLIYDWEDAVGFRYQEEIWKGRAGAENQTHQQFSRS